MRKFGISIFLLIYVSPILAQQSVFFPAFEETPLRTVLLYLESNHQLVFSYRDTNVESQKISLEEGNFELRPYLDLLFAQTALDFEFIDATHILLRKKKNTLGLPGYFCAHIKDRNSGQALSFANVFVKDENRGTNASDQGWFELNDLKSKDTLLISYIGYQTLALAIDTQWQSNCATVFLDIEATSIPMVEVTEYLTDGISQNPKGQSISIDPDRLSILPGAVEPDVMTSIQMLPGVLSPNETASGIHIRGGTPDQNLVLWDGIPVYHTGHFFGMISAFNPYIVEGIDVYRSGMGSEFGGRVSGVVDIKSKSKIPKRFTIGAGLNMTHGHLNATLPLFKTAAISLSLRRSFTDFWPMPTFLRYAEKVFQGTKLEDGDFNNPGQANNDNFYFSDANLKWIWNPGKNKFGFNIFVGENHLNYLSEIPELRLFTTDVVTLRNEGSSLFWKREWSKKFSSSLQFNHSAYKYNYRLSLTNPQDTVERVLFDLTSRNNVVDDGINLINEWRPDERHRLKFGYQLTNNKLSFGLKKETETDVEETNQNFKNVLSTIFAEYQLTLADILEMNVGLRYQRQVIINNDYFEPRIAISARINDHLRLKLSSSKQFQFISQLIILDINDIGINNQIWIASDNLGIPVIESNQWSGGLLYSDGDWTLDVEGYVKELAGITSLSNGFSNILDQPFSRGDSRIRGIDVLLKRRIQNYRTWLSYTLAKTVYEFSALQENAFPASHDQRHTLQWVQILTKNNWEFSLGWQFRAGLPFTIPTGVRLDDNNDPNLEYGQQNANRLKPYHRLDASMMYHFGDKKKISGFAGISFINLYNATNELERRFLLDSYEEATGAYELLELNKVGLKFTPNLVVRMEW